MLKYLSFTELKEFFQVSGALIDLGIMKDDMFISTKITLHNQQHCNAMAVRLPRHHSGNKR
jgi:hypothetical protein